jgi:uncharacterized membrane protein HdeD (DUF308 family)
MRLLLAKNWWSLALRGAAAILFGILTFLWPHITLTVLVFLFAGYALVNGVLSLAGAVRAAEARDRWGPLVVEGIIGILAAGITLFWPAITALALVFLVAAWAVITGVLEVAAAIRLRQHIRGEWLWALAGACSIIFGILLAARPIVGALIMALWIGAYLIVFGVTMVALGFRLRNWTRGGHDWTTRPVPAH